MIINLLGGVLIGAGLFAATLFSIYQAAIKSSWFRWAHLAAVILTIMGAASISLVAPLTGFLAGVSLLICGTVVFLLEHRWNKLLALFQIIFAIALILGLPFVAQ